MHCISIVSYFMVLNGETCRNFSLGRGLREGDPFSPYFFLICSERLSSLMHMLLRKKMVNRAKINQRGPKISHLLFTDECILFGEATINGAMILK